MLAAWFRLKYPHIAIGALASSAPVLHFDNIVPLTSFYDAVSQDFKVLYALFPVNFMQKKEGDVIMKCCYKQDASVNCFKVIKRSWEELEAVSNMKQGLLELSNKFRTCK